MNKHNILLVGTLAVLLAACGGGGSDSGPPVAETDVPASASASVKAMVDYLSDLVGASSDSAEPLGLAAFDPPKAETTEPAELK